jgi:ABC-type transport system involved in multi-copper enzyme maturation permease subunit
VNLFRVTFVEMRRALHRRLVRWMIVVALGACVFVAAVVFNTSDNATELLTDPQHPANMYYWWYDHGQGFLTVAASFLAIGAAICGASVAGAEWKAGTVTTILTWVPSRWRLHGARSISAAVLAFVISFLLQIVFLAAALPAVFANGSTDGTDGQWWSSLVAAMLRVSLMSAMLAVLALSLATLTRNTAAALVTLAVWALVVEGLIRGYKPHLARYLITENVVTFVGWSQMKDASFRRGPLTALAALLLYLGIVVLAATTSFVRRDVAAAT